MRRAGSPNSLTSRSWVSVSMMVGHRVVGYFLPCHSRSPASRAEVSVPTIEVGHHCLAATGLMPRAVQSRAIEATDSPVLQHADDRVPERLGLYRIDVPAQDMR